ncbi:hypothetical protein BC332_19440 [Capsicum chinense]|nr:hypothetical protein BC332_19440 [Capsicum chinense]
MSLLYKRYLNKEQKIMNTGRRNLSKEMIQMLIALPSKSWSKPSALIVTLESCFGQYLDLSEDNNARFQMKMVYDLLKRRFMYENKDKMDEVWINYCGMPVCFGPNFKNKNLIEALKGKWLSEKHKQSLCLVWFVHNVLWVRHVNNNISLDLINLSEDLETFNNYPWGYESFKMTVEYWLTPLTPKTVNLYGFPWAFMILPHLVNVLHANFKTCARATEEQHELKKVRTDWSTIEAYRDKMANSFDVQDVDGIAQKTIRRLDCGPFVVTYAEYLSDGLQVPNDGLDVGLLRKIYAALL